MELSNAFEVRLIPEQSCWINLPSSYSLRLVAAGATRRMPLIFQLSILTDNTGRETNPLMHKFVSWRGSVVSSNHVGSPVVEIPSMLGECLGLRHGMFVLLLPLFQPISMPPSASSVTLEPLTEDDWEVLEANASHVEEVVLQQTAVLAQGQLVPLWLRGQALIRLQVTSCQLPPSSSSSGGDPRSLLSKVVRVTDGCELHVAPKMRKKEEEGMKRERKALLQEVGLWEEKSTWLRVLAVANQSEPCWEGYDLIVNAPKMEPQEEVQPDELQPDGDGGATERGGERLAAMKGGPMGSFLIRTLTLDSSTLIPRGHALVNPDLLRALGIRAGAHLEFLMSKKNAPDVQCDDIKDLNPKGMGKSNKALSSDPEIFMDTFSPQFNNGSDRRDEGDEEVSMVPWLKPQLDTCIQRLRPRLSLKWALRCQQMALSTKSQRYQEGSGLGGWMALASGCGGGVLVTGGVGSGKTRLMTSLAR